LWTDYAIYLTTGAVVLAGVGLAYVIAWGRGGWIASVVSVSLILVAGVGTYLVRPENSRMSTGSSLVVVDTDRGLEADVEWIGLCLSFFRRVGPLSYITGSDLFPGGNWDRRPVSSCDAMGVSGSVRLPDSVRSGNWMLCDYSKCYQLVNGLDP
jgi:hypothetical protein